MVGIAIATRSAFGAPGVLAVTGHPAVSSIVVSRDLGDAASHFPTLRGVPCLILEFCSERAADEALGRLRVISAKFTHQETPTRIACSNGVQFTLRLVRDFDEPTIAAIAAHHDDAIERYAAAQRDAPRSGAGRARR
jgi:hypothetical protein